MKEKKLQVFVSSTYTDLIEERQAAVEAILSAGHIPAGMELFTAGDESQMTVIKRWIDESDVYLLILGGRYGSIDENSGKSYTHLEYEYALSIGKPIFSVVIKPEALEEKVKKIGTSATELVNGKELIAFKEIVLTTLVKFWHDVKDIKLAIYETLSEFSHREELIGWIRGDQRVNGNLLAEEIAKLTRENSELRERLLKSPLQTEVLYCGLTYAEISERLQSKAHPNPEREGQTMFDYFIEICPTLTEGAYLLDKTESLKFFRELRLVFRNDYEGGRAHYSLSEDGHKLYLKATSIKAHGANRADDSVEKLSSI